MRTDEKFCLKWNEFQDIVKSSFGELREENDFTDVTLACENHQSILQEDTKEEQTLSPICFHERYNSQGSFFYSGLHVLWGSQYMS